MSKEKGVGGLPDAGTIKPGAPGHIEDHDEMARLMQQAADTLGIVLDPPPPPPAVIGEYGHVDAHNTLLANIEQLAEAGGGGLPGELPGLGGWADVTAVTGTGTKYEYTADGMDWSAFEWSVPNSYSDAFTTTDGLLEILVVGGGGQNSNSFANSGGAKESLVRVLGSYDVVVGAGKPNQQGSRVGSVDPEADQLLACAVTIYGSGNTYPIGETSNNGIYKGLTSSLTGQTIEYARGAYPVDQSTTPGSATKTPENPNVNDGVVIIRVPRASDKTGLAAGPFDTVRIRDKVKKKIRDKQTSPVTQEIEE